MPTLYSNADIPQHSACLGARAGSGVQPLRAHIRVVQAASTGFNDLFERTAPLVLGWGWKRIQGDSGRRTVEQR